MLSLPGNCDVDLCCQPVDLRKSFDGLCAAVEMVFQRNVFDGPLFLFINQRRDRIKALWWDRDGLVMVYKRLEAGVFELPAAAGNEPHLTLDATALAMLLGGVPLATPRRKRSTRTPPLPTTTLSPA